MSATDTMASTANTNSKKLTLADAAAIRDPKTGERLYGAEITLRRDIWEKTLPHTRGPRGQYLVTLEDLEKLRIRRWARQVVRSTPPVTDVQFELALDVMREARSR